MDESFANNLYNALTDAGIRVWYAKKDMRGGKKMIKQINDALNENDKLLLIISDNSLKSEWVKSEIRNTLKIEKKSGKRKLFPLRITDMEKIKKWSCFDHDIGKDLGVELREYYIPDFTGWVDKETFNHEIEKLIKDLLKEKIG